MDSDVYYANEEDMDTYMLSGCEKVRSLYDEAMKKRNNVMTP